MHSVISDSLCLREVEKSEHFAQAQRVSRTLAASHFMINDDIASANFSEN